MFISEELENHLKTASTIETQSRVFIEWNGNQPESIERLGNYRYRPGVIDPEYSAIMTVYDPVDSGNFYTGATDSDIIVDGGFDDSGTPLTFSSKKEKMNMLYSLEDCIKSNRPRSGINKMLYLGLSGSTDYTYNQYVDDISRIIARRPRYYVSSKDDSFKYWTSFRYDNVNGESVIRGVSKPLSAGDYFIDDVAPFVVYKEDIATNKIVIKVQTNVGDQSINDIRVGQQLIPDPLYGDENKTTPKNWRVEVLKENVWTTVKTFDQSSVREDGTPIFKADGYVEVSYGIAIPEQYRDTFIYAETISSTDLLPDNAPVGYAYLVQQTDNTRGTFYIYTGNISTVIPGWESFIPEYGWDISEETLSNNAKVVTKFSDPDYFVENSQKIFREFDIIRGIRIVVDTMNKDNCTFDLIELSPRLFCDVSDYTLSFNVTKTLSDLGNGSIPVGSLLASVGSLQMFDNDYSFNQNNVFDKETGTGSILANLLDTVMKVTFYDVIMNVNGNDYFIPVKSLYSQGFPQVSDQGGTIGIELRDLFYFLESEKAVPMLLTDISMSYAITVLLDGIGFSNYVFKRVEGESELIIPFFFVSPDDSVATVLQNLAIASQSAMFFDEYNNLVVMSKNYLLPSENDRETDTIILGQDDGDILPNIINLSSQEKKVFNSGQINYTKRYINRSIGSIEQAPYVNEYQTYIYKPSILWEVAGREKRQAINDIAPESNGFSLAAVPLNTDLTSDTPYVLNNTIYNNVFDLGENVYWLQSFSGYMYANGEIIKYDAIEYSVAGVGNVWISNNLEYQDYMASLQFNGKMYPTGNVRIWAEPQYYTQGGVTYMSDGPIGDNKHGRGQFGTQVASHSAGILTTSSWVDNNYIRGCIQDTKRYLFSMNNRIQYPSVRGVGNAGKNKYISGTEVVATELSKTSSRTGIIKNFLANKNDSELSSSYTSSTLSGSVQASALVFNGPQNIPADLRQADLVSYIYKPLEDRFAHFGTRMRIVGKIESGTNKSQTPFGGFSLLPSDYVTASDPSKSTTVAGGSGGLGINVNPNTNNGYFMEIVSLTADNLSGYTNNGAETSYVIAKYPEGTVATVVNNVVTVTTEQINNFIVGDKVIISGLIDKNRTTNTNTPVNGEFEVTEISTNRKTFKYNLPIPSVTSVAIASASGDGQYITYNTSAYHDLRAGQLVTISGSSNSNFNKTSAVIHSVTNPDGGPWSIKIAATNTGTSTGGTATYVPLNTQCWNGGLATKTSDEQLTIDNIFFYKVVSGQNISEIVKFKRQNNIVTITTLNPHSFVNGEKITVNNSTNTSINGTFDIIVSPTAKSVTSGGVTSTISTTDRTFCFAQTGANIAETTLTTLGTATAVNPSAIPEVLWKGYAEILVDDGKFTGQTRFSTTEKPTVYDLAIEYVDIGPNRRRFYLYINGRRVSVVEDQDALPKYSNMALFVRGSSNCMFENVYALGNNYAQETSGSLQTPISDVFDNDLDLDSNEALTKYAVSGLVQQTYLSGIGTQEPPKYKIYFEEFGTIMREVAHFNIRYDRAYPALIARIAPTINKVKGYSVSGFYAGPYGADFLVFNCIDKNLNLDDTTGNYLRIHGVTFTQSTTYSLTVDDYFEKLSNLSDPVIESGTILYNPEVSKEVYDSVKQSRMRYGRNEFSIESPYIQTTSAAEEILGWTINKVMKPRKNVGINAFAVNNLQLGDIVNIDYVREGVDVISDESKRYVVYNIEYKKDIQGIQYTIYLAEV